MDRYFYPFSLNQCKVALKLSIEKLTKELVLQIIR